MGLLSRVKQLFIREEEFAGDEFEDWFESNKWSGGVDFEQGEIRKEYVEGCLERIKEGSIEIDNLQEEYDLVTEKLKDLEEIEALPESETRELKAAAESLANLEIERRGHEAKSVPMDEMLYHKLDAFGEQLKDGIESLTEAEKYHDLVKQDMKRLSREREAYVFRKSELKKLLYDLRAMTAITLTAVIVCVVLLLVLQFGFSMNTQLGYLLAAAMAALALTYIFFRQIDAKKDLKRVEKSVNKLINLHNTVKIRYVNNTNLLEYLRIKYGVNSADELFVLNTKYQAEKKRREEYLRLEKDLSIAESDFLRIIRRYKVSDPLSFLHMTNAILDKREMVEARHGLIIRRQSLRKRIEYNKETVIKEAQDEIKKLVADYPRYASEIRDMVAEFDKKYG